ncbi:nuclear transport factor 2 family protein [Photobacterium sp. R1]
MSDLNSTHVVRGEDVPETETVMDTFVRLYTNLDKHNLASLADLYHPDVVFEDPAHRVMGRQALDDYFLQLYKHVTHCRFDIHQTLVQNQADQQQGCVVWTMNFAHPRIDQGQLRQVQGCSVLRFQENRVIYHRDYFDLGEMVYEGIPILGRVIKTIKAGLS